MTSNNLPALDALADKINTEHEACHASMQKGLDHALKAGALLLEAKAGLPHGEWLPWLGENCPDISERTIQNYMRLGREIPKLEPEKAQRVADLSYREAVRVMSQNFNSIGHASLEEQEIIITALGDGKSLPQARIEAARAITLPVDHVPEALKPEPGKRRVGILSNRDGREVCVVIGPNQAGINLSKNLEVVRGGDLYVEWRDQIADLKAKASELRKEAEHLEVQARGQHSDMMESLACDIEEDHGPALYYVETWDYALDDEQWGELQSKQRPEDVAAYVAEVGHLNKRGWWGDITLQSYSANGPIHSVPIGGNGWNGWGSSEWLEEFFPDNLAPKTAQA